MNSILSATVLIPLIVIVLLIVLLCVGYVKAPPDMAYIISGVKKKSKVVEAGEAFNEHVIQPINHAIPRAVSSTANRVHVDDELRQMQEIFYSMSDEELREGLEDDSATVAIPKGVLKDAVIHDHSGRPMLKGTEEQGDEDGKTSAGGEGADAAPYDRSQEDSPSTDVSSNPRKGWR